MTSRRDCIRYPDFSWLSVPHVMNRFRNSFVIRHFVVAFLPVHALMGSYGHRTNNVGFSPSPDGTDRPTGRIAPTPQRFHRSHHQGPQSGIARIGRIRATTVAALQTGGASQSKWARRSRPWNTSTSTTVVASPDEVFESTIFKSVLRFASAGDEAGRSRGRSLRPRCPKGQPHQRSPRRECVRAGGPRRSVFATPDPHS